MLIKDFDRYYLADNAEIVCFLQGENPERLAWLPRDHPLIGEGGVILDRERSPVMFHRVSGTKFEFRSAGPDRQPWSDDVVVR